MRTEPEVLLLRITLLSPLSPLESSMSLVQTVESQILLEAPDELGLGLSEVVD
jgi:hypothetical protein